MTRDTRELSLKRPDGSWGGLDDATTMAPGLGAFVTLNNCLINRDGSEIMRAPGSVVSAECFLGQSYSISALGSGSNPTLTLVPTAGSVFGDHLCNGAADHVVYIRNNSDIPEGVYLATRLNATQLRINGATGAGSATGSIWVSRAASIHALISVNGRPCVVAKTVVHVGGVTPTYNVSTWVGGTPLSITTPLTPGIIGSGNPNDTGVVHFRTTTMEHTMAATSSAGVGDPTPSTWPFYYQIDSRMCVDVMNGRLLIAVPGVMHLFEVNLETAPPKFTVRPLTISGLSDTPSHRWTKMLGIPKGCFAATPTTSVTGSGTFPAGTYYFRVAYFDPYTGEVGLASDPVRHVQTATGKVTLTIHTPRGECVEAVGLGIVVLGSEVNEAENTILFPVFVRQPRGIENDPEHFVHSGAGGESSTYASIDITAPVTRNTRLQPNRQPDIELMHPGASWLRVIRGRLFAGGARPDTLQISGKFKSEPATVSGSGLRYMLGIVSGLNSRTKRAKLPASYAGWRVVSETVVSNILHQGKLGKRLNARSITGTPSSGDHRTVFEVDFPDTNSADRTLHLRLQPDLVSFSEEGFPGISPATNRLETDRIAGRRTTGAARVGDAMLLFTDRSTELYTWAGSPRKSSSVTASHQYGCVAPSSIVDGPFGAAWLSQDGPCVFANGGVQWIGKPIHGLWLTLKRDSEGQMPFALGSVDLTRRVVIWTVRRAAFPSAYDVDDASRAQSPCDLWIVWNYETGAFSTIDRIGATTSVGSQAIAYMPHADGTWRTAWMVDHTSAAISLGERMAPIYSWHDTGNDRTHLAQSFTAIANKTPGSLVFDAGLSTAPTNVSVGDQAYVRKPDGTLRWFGVLDAFGGGGYTLDSAASAAQWETGDVLTARVIHMTLETMAVRSKLLSYDTKIGGVVIRAVLEPPKDINGTAATQYAWARVRVTDEAGVVRDLNRNTWGDTLRTGTTRFREGRMPGGDLKVRIDVIGNGMVKIKDIALEIEP